MLIVSRCNDIAGVMCLQMQIGLRREEIAKDGTPQDVGLVIPVKHLVAGGWTYVVDGVDRKLESIVQQLLQKVSGLSEG